MLDKDKIEMKALMESAAVADYLKQLAKGFESGAIVVEKDGESLTLTPAETAEVEVEARIKKDKARFSLEVSWRTEAAYDEPASLKISAETPKEDAAPAGADAKPEAAKPCCHKDAPKPEAAKPAEKHAAKPEASNKPEGNKPEPAKAAVPAAAVSKPAGK